MVLEIRSLISCKESVFSLTTAPRNLASVVDFIMDGYIPKIRLADVGIKAFIIAFIMILVRSNAHMRWQS